MALGWGVAGAAHCVQWLVFGVDVTFGAAPWALTGAYLYSAAAIGVALATFGLFRLFFDGPPASLATETAAATRATALVGGILWGLGCAVIALGCWRGWSGGAVFLAHLPLLVAAILLGFHCRVLYVVAFLLGRSERALQASTIGFPVTVFLLLVASAWFSLIGRIALISFVSFVFTTLFCGVFSVRFFYANVDVGVGIRWARRNLDEAHDRYLRKVGKWEARARADREKEKRFGTSVRH